MYTNITETRSTFSCDGEQRLSAINGSYNGAQKLALAYAYNNAQQISGMDESLVSSLRRLPGCLARF